MRRAKILLARSKFGKVDVLLSRSENIYETAEGRPGQKNASAATQKSKVTHSKVKNPLSVSHSTTSALVGGE